MGAMSTKILERMCMLLAGFRLHAAHTCQNICGGRDEPANDIQVLMMMMTSSSRAHDAPASCGRTHHCCPAQLYKRPRKGSAER
mmetsp:Transcript_23314/g.71421  ORF Transcript_23314/g.71421 Transcript_23314/m.71421 type:complete len:84 (+) Transcript_23314:297-548(+)|eukprot:scaffold249724_cov44-Tisochrysis_lutea.AAC.1